MRQVIKRKQDTNLEPFSELPAPTTNAGNDSAQLQRIAALKEIFGIWKGRDDVPQDGLAYQLEIRAE